MYPVLLSGYSRKYCPNNPEYAPGERWEIELLIMMLELKNSGVMEIFTIKIT